MTEATETMAQILAIDASTEVCSVAVNTLDVCISRYCDTPKSHSKVLLPLIDEVLAEASVPLQALDAIAVTCGPGSFTGIRIGMGIVQGLSYAIGAPIIGINTLECMSEQFCMQTESDTVPLVIALDARMGEIYWAVFDVTGNSWQQRLSARVSAPEELCEWLQTHAQEEIVGIGHGWTLPQLQQQSLHTLLPEFKPHAEGALNIGKRLFANPQVEYKVGVVAPVYLRNEITWQKRKRIRA